MSAPCFEPISPVVALARLWAVARAGQQASAAIATRPGADEQLRWTRAAGHFGEAADELQRVRPAVAGSVDVPSWVAELEDASPQQATTSVAAGVVAALAEFDPTSPLLSPDDLLAAGNAAYWLGMAYHVLMGQLP